VPNKFIRVFTQGFFLIFKRQLFIQYSVEKHYFIQHTNKRNETYINPFKLPSQLYTETVGPYREIKIHFLNISMRLNRAGTLRTHDYGHIYVLLFIKFLCC